MSGFTRQEMVAIQEFRKRLEDVFTDMEDNDFGCRNDSLIRWIRAREMNLNKAEDMFRHSRYWRINNKIDAILDLGTDPDMDEKFPYFLDGVDKAGRPIVTMHYGIWDVRSCIEEDGGLDRFSRYCNQFLEKVSNLLKRTTLEIAAQKKDKGEPDDESDCIQFVAVFNMEGYSYRQLTNMKAVQTLIQLVSVYEAHYPETLAKCVVINAPAIFSILFGLMKPFLSPRTLNKIQVFSSKKHQWQPALMELMELNQIREQFGGSKVEE